MMLKTAELELFNIYVIYNIYNIINVFIITFDHFKPSLLNKSINFYHLFSKIINTSNKIIIILTLEWYSEGFLKSFPGGPICRRVYLQPWSNSPTCDFLIIFKSLISMLRCVWLGLELNSAGVARFEDAWCSI